MSLYTAKGLPQIPEHRGKQIYRVIEANDAAEAMSYVKHQLDYTYLWALTEMTTLTCSVRRVRVKQQKGGIAP